VLELRDVTLFVGRGEEVRPLLSDVSARFPRGHFAAVIGPSGCGKSTLLKVIAGIAQGEEEGEIRWDDRNLAEEDFSPSEIGYVPQFSIAHEELTAGECVENSARLRIAGMGGDALEEKTLGVLSEVGLEDFRDHDVRLLSGGQRRRLALAMEIVSAPAMLLCDEVTSGLDPQAEDEIVNLLHGLSRHDGRLVLSVTHSLRHLSLYDSVIVLYRGVLAYHGPTDFLNHYFRVEDAQDLYGQLEKRDPKQWASSWRKHKHVFLEAMGGHVEPEIGDLSFDSAAMEVEDRTMEITPPKKHDVLPRPGALSQFTTLLERRFTIFLRNRGQLLLQLGLVFGFPFLVAIFAWNGLPEVKNLSMGLNLDVVQQLVESKDFLVNATKVGSLVSGIVMFQVVLLTLMGANNSGREIAAERLIFEKEKLAGVRAGSYVASKVVFLSLLVAAQSLWMGTFVHFICGFPGDLAQQLVFLFMVNAAMTSVCLAISSWMQSAEQASLVSIYLVGFQLPLSGAVLALPDWMGGVVRPFIAAYWSWSGVLGTLRGERTYDIVQMVVQTALSPGSLCLWVLTFHVLCGILLTTLGCSRSRIE